MLMNRPGIETKLACFELENLLYFPDNDTCFYCPQALLSLNRRSQHTRPLGIPENQSINVSKAYMLRIRRQGTSGAEHHVASPHMLHNVKRLWMWLQSMYDRKQLVGSYNWLCSKLLDVQVTLSQNKPKTMSDQDRNVAAAKFQHSMQVSCPPQMLSDMSVQPCSCLQPQVAFLNASSCHLVLCSRALDWFMQVCVRCIRVPRVP